MSTEAASLTAEQRLVLQAIYDHFHAHATWPSFISIDRPLRRGQGLDTAAIVLTLPESFIVPPRPGNLRPIADDELRLRLPGIHACTGGPDDTERFAHLLRWLARLEMDYEPEPGSGETMPRVTSQEVASHLGLRPDGMEVARLYAMLHLDNWGLGGSGGTPADWFVQLREDVWRFRDVQTVEDIVRAREEWISEAQAKVPRMRDPLPTWHYHVRVSTKSKPDSDDVRLDLSEDQLETFFLAPYREGRAIVINGKTISLDNLSQLRISRSEPSSRKLRLNPLFQAELRTHRTWATNDDWLTAHLCEDVTGHFITEPPRVPGPPPPLAQLPTSTNMPYVNQLITDSLRAKEGKSQFNVAKLLRLIEELNDNYGRKNSYATHALIRAILDHIPPILSQRDFNAVVNNYSWGRTDRKYLKKLMDFRDQADDALHRQISAQADLLDFEDVPSSVCVDRLLQVCVTHL